MPKQFIIFVIVALVALGGYLLLNNISNNRTASNTQEVVTSFYVPAFFAERITAGTDIAVTNLAGARDPHDYDPTRADIDRMRDARIVIANGGGLETWIEDIEADLTEADTALLVLADHVALYELMDAHEDEHNSDEHEESYEADMHEEGEDHGVNEHDQEHEEEHEDGEEKDEHGHDHGGVDPHAWLDPVLAQDMVAEITTALVATFPEAQATLETNAQTLNSELAALDTTYAERLATCTVAAAIISHDAAGYLARRYDLTFHAIAGLSTEDEPSAKLLAELAEEAADKRAILAEEGTVTTYAETLSRETGLEMVPLNPLGRGPLTDDKDYFDVMYANLDSLAYAFGCDTTQ